MTPAHPRTKPEWRIWAKATRAVLDAFDRAGTRLGYGKGFYDRFLAAAPPNVPVVGVVSESLVVETLPRTPHDVPMTHLLSERGVHPVALGGRF